MIKCCKYTLMEFKKENTSFVFFSPLLSSVSKNYKEGIFSLFFKIYFIFKNHLGEHSPDKCYSVG
jgi:hypothetical protein